MGDHYYLLGNATADLQAEIALAVQNYLNKWKNKHPQPEDMQAAFEEAVGSNPGKFFSLTKKKAH